MSETFAFDNSRHINADERATARQEFNRTYRLSKRIFDLVVSAFGLVLLLPICAVLVLLNPFANRGPLIFTQIRMGKDHRPFKLYKFRTMSTDSAGERTADSPLELDRITWLGGLMRKIRLDELPQVINVLRGEMSVIGPRPDAYEHAQHFLTEIPGYKERYAILPGMTGLAQTEIGYAEGTEATRRKVKADLYYIQNRNLRLETWIAFRTVAVVLGGQGT